MSLITSYGAVNGYIIKQMDRFAKMKKTIKETLDAYTDYKFWTLVDSTGDETYENRVKGSLITTVDAKLNEGKIGHLSQDWFTLHTSYFTNDLSITNGLTGFLDSVGVRVHEDFANVHSEAGNTRLAARLIFADEEKEANIVYEGTSGNAVIAATSLASTLGDTRLQVVGGGTISALTLGDTNSNTSTMDSFIPGVGEFLGESPCTAPQPDDTTITLTTVGRAVIFKTNQYVMLESTADSSLTEIVRLHASTAPNATTGVLTLAAGTTVKYDYSGGCVAYPLFNKVASITHTGDVTIKPVNDRVITWGE